MEINKQKIFYFFTVFCLLFFLSNKSINADNRVVDYINRIDISNNNQNYRDMLDCVDILNGYSIAQLEDVLKKILLLVIEQYQSMTDFFVVMPIKYDIPFSKKNFVITDYQMKKKTFEISVSEKIEKKGINFTILKITVKDKKTKEQPRQIKKAISKKRDGFAQIKINDKISVFRFFNTVLDIFFIGIKKDAVVKSNKAPVQGSFVKTDNLYNVNVAGEKAAIQQGIVVFELSEVADLKPEKPIKPEMLEQPFKILDTIEAAEIENIPLSPQKPEEIKTEKIADITKIEAEEKIVIEDKKEPEIATEPPKKEEEQISKTKEQIAEIKEQIITQEKEENAPPSVENKEVVIKEQIQESPAAPIEETKLESVAPEPVKIIVSYIKRIAPSENALVKTKTPEFRWAAYSGADKYQLFISALPFSMANLILFKELQDNNYIFSNSDAVAELQDKTKYAWLVIATDKNGDIISKRDADAVSFFSLDISEKTADVIISENKVPVINSIMINNKQISAYSKGENICIDDLIDGNLKLNFIIQNFKNVKEFLLSINGSDYFSVNVNKIDDQQNIEYFYTPRNDMRFEFRIKIVNNDGSNLADDYFDELYLNYTHKTNIKMISDLIDDFCRAILYNDKDLFMNCIYENFSSNNFGYRDYNEIENTIKTEFKRTTTSLCSAKNKTIRINNSQRAEVNFQFIRYMRFIDIDVQKRLTVDSKFDLIKTDGNWKILSDRNNLNFKLWFPEIPLPPQL